MTGIFVYEAGDISHFASFLRYVLAVVIVFVYTFGVTYLLYWLTNKMIPLRVSAASERVGLDKSQHNEHYGPETGGPRELAEYADAHADA